MLMDLINFVQLVGYRLVCRGGGEYFRVKIQVPGKLEYILALFRRSVTLKQVKTEKKWG
jgi:hypothetical protein